MTEEQKYNAVLRGIGELLKIKDDEIAILKYQIKDLSDKLRDAEKHACGSKPANIEIR